uniref:Phosphoribosylglycinamide synthetase N-terminal domain-containing protein n=1 Tax=Brassica oleracea var. oleracea TaxID=109376 RepID=A0A0D2ZTE9_BRAOL
MSFYTSNLHPSSSSINLFSNNNNSPKPSLSSLRFSTSTSPSSSVAPLSFSTTNHALSSPFPSNHIQSRQLWLRCVTSESEPSISVAPGGNGGTGKFQRHPFARLIFSVLTSFQLLQKRVIVLVIGTGGREHALCHALKRSPSCNSVLCAPGNPDITSSGDATCVPDLDVSDSSAVISFCRKQNVGLVVVGPEVPLDFDCITEMCFYSQLDFERI